MADLAKLVVRLEMQSAQLLKGLDQANGKLASFEKSTGAALARIDKRFQKVGSGLKTAIGILAGAVSFKAIVDASADAAKNFALLENAVAQAGDAAGGRTARQFADVSKELQNISTYSDDSIQNVQQLLLRFQNIRTDRFDDATKSVLNLAAALGTDLDSAAKLLGKALSDPEKGVTALAKAGVVLSDSQKDVVKNLVETGKTADAQAVLLDALEKKYGGAAEAARNNFGGALQGVRNSLNDLMEVDGGLPGATSSLNELAKVLADPGVKAGADALFSILIRGASAAAELIGKTVAGIAIIAGYGQDAAVNKDDEIAALMEQRERLQRGFRGGPGIAEAAKQIEELDKKIIKATEDYWNLVNPKKPPANMAPATPAGGMNEDEDPSEKAAKAAEKLQKQLEAAGKALSEKLLTPMERYDAAVAEADKLLAAHTITTTTWAYALGAARAELNGVSDGILDVSERYQTLEQQIEAGRGDLVDSIQSDLEESNKRAIDKIEQQTKEADKRLTVFSEQPARNTQDILADGLRTALHDGFDDGAKGALEAFGNMLEQMALQAIAADIAGKIFGEDGKGGGWLDSLFGGSKGSSGSSNIVEGEWDWLSSIGAIFGYGGTRDAGGRGRSGEAVMIGTGAQPEMFVPDTAGDFYPAGTYGGGNSLVQNIYTTSPMTQRSARQLELESGKRQRIASARLG